MTPSREEAPALLAALAERGCELAATGELEALAELDAPWSAAVDALRGATLSPAGAALVRRAHALQGEQAAILQAAHADVGAELRRLGRTREGARGYAQGGLPVAGRRVSATA
jgi:hypothetical protein